MPEYLMMYFCRPEFDRYARFHSHGSAREVFDWEEMCNVMLPVPDIEIQRQIVEQYQTLETRIQNNRKRCTTLEQTAQALYTQTFVEGIDKEHLPDGWRMGTLGKVCSKLGSGSTPKGGKGRAVSTSKSNRFHSQYRTIHFTCGIKSMNFSGAFI
jgi:type I restriction enzyme, S subunit